MISDAVRAAIIESGLKYKFIADKIGVSEQAFSAIVAGQRKITADEYFKLCEVLGKNPKSLYYGK